MLLERLPYYCERSKDRLVSLYFALSRKSDPPYSDMPAGLIGCGNFVRYAYIPAFNRAGMPVVVMGLLSGKHGSSEKTAKLLRYRTRVFASFKEMADSGVRCVVLAAPNHTHYEYICAALGSGMDIFCEKPVTNSLGEAEDVGRCLKDKGKILMVGFNQRHTDRVRKVKEFIGSGRLGNVLEANAFHNQDIASRIEGSDWLNDAKKSGGGILHNAGIHLVNLMLYFFGPVESVRAVLENRRLPIPCGEDTVRCDLYFRSGARGSLEASCINGVRSSYEHLVINGTKGSLYTDMKTCSIRFRPVGSPSWKDVGCRKESVVDSVFNELVYFHDCVKNRRKPDTDIYDSIDTLKVIEASRVSASGNDKVSIK